MSFTAPTEFLSFPKLPFELRQMVWDEVLPTLDLQRFNAEIAPNPNYPNSKKSEDLVLCLTPNQDLVQLTSGYLGLLGACHESRWAAVSKIKCYLTINCITRDANGTLAVRSARVPFNPDGHLCISGLGPAFDDAAEGYGARGVELQASHWSKTLAENIQCVTFSEIRNLTISLDSPRNFESKYQLMRGWDDRVFDIMAKRMINLETVALVDEGVLNERHQIPPKDFEWLHKPALVVRPSEDNDGWDYELDEPSGVRVPWLKLYSDFKSSLGTFNAIKQLRAGSR